MRATLNSKHIRPDGSADTFHTFTAPAIVSEMWRHTRGLQYTASGYGKRIPTPYKVFLNNRWRRVYCCIFSNSGTLYIGDYFKKIGEVITVGDIS